jgi:hypothetical protein
MATVTMLEVMNRTKSDRWGSLILESFKRIELHSKKFIKKHRKSHKIPHVTCHSDEDICIRQDEFRWVNFEKAVECRFIGDDDLATAKLTRNLKTAHEKQEESGFEKDRFFSIQLFLADNPKSGDHPDATSMGVLLEDVQIMSFEFSGRLVIATFSAMDAKPLNV